MVDADNKTLLELFENARVADVRDGMDAVGYHGRGSMDPSIRPLWRTRAVGIARTARYVPYDGPIPQGDVEEYKKWTSMYYGEICTYPWSKEIEPGDFMVIDVSGVDAGLMGSENGLAAKGRGARGFVTNGGGVRDTDELILTKVPFWSVYVSQSMVQGRLRFEAKDVAVSVGGVTVFPGDVVIADGDGVIVVPRKIAFDVAEFANAEHKRDMANRRRHYEQQGMELDQTVKGSGS